MTTIRRHLARVLNSILLLDPIVQLAVAAVAVALVALAVVATS
jgi:hypothetical protein